MSNLNPQQFEDAAAQRGHELLQSIRRDEGVDVGDYGGHPGEPDPDTYNSMDDYLADHRRWSSSRAGGKPFRDFDRSKLKARAEKQEEPVRQEHQEKQRKVAVQRTQLGRAVRDMKRAMPRVPKPPKKLTMPGKVKRRKIY